MPKQHTQIFSVSAKNTDEISAILSSVSNKSEFICQAIIEKNKSSEKSLRSTIESVILEMILGGKLNMAQTTIEAKPIETQIIDEITIDTKTAENKPEPKAEIDDDLRSVSRNW